MSAMNWSIDFAPVLRAPFFWAAGALALLLVGYLLFRRSRGALLRAAALAALIAALANPYAARGAAREPLQRRDRRRRREREPDLGDRKAQTAAVKAELEAKLKKIPNLDVKWVDRPPSPAT